MTLWDDVKTNLSEWYTAAADKTGDLAKVGVRRYDSFGLSRDIERHFSEIGSLVYDALNEERRDVLDDPVLISLVEKVRDLEKELQDKEAEISAIKTAAEQRKAERAASEEVPPEAPDAGEPLPDTEPGPVEADVVDGEEKPTTD